MYFQYILIILMMFSCTIQSITFVNKTGEDGKIWWRNSKEEGRRPRNILRPFSLANNATITRSFPLGDYDNIVFETESGKSSPKIFVKNLEDYNIITFLPKELFYKEEARKISSKVKEVLPQLPSGVTDITGGYAPELEEGETESVQFAYKITIDEQAKKEAAQELRTKISKLEAELAHYKEKLQKAES